MDKKEISEKYLELRDLLLSERNSDGFWTGRLSTSALSTAVGIVALRVARNDSDRKRVDDGFLWLCQNINADGGYGDTPGSVSNVSTTLLCYAAVTYCQTNDNGSRALANMEKWLSAKGIAIDPESVTGSILRFYGKDYTFSLPILSMLILCEVIPPSSIERIPRLPFELTLLPASFYRFLNLRVVSYALPALIGVGIYLHRNRKKGFLRRGVIRDQFVKPSVEKLTRLVPESGGFLEAIPLTGFVSMCLIASGESDNIIVEKGLEFLRNQQHEDGGWPIDTNLSTWVTTLSVKALGDQIQQALAGDQLGKLRDHLLNLQYKTSHLFNYAKPGGWGWTSYSGSVPDADDTPGAIIALLGIYTGINEELIAVENGCKWLIDLQNSDGGFPTFCRGWGKLPFDKSCADLTGHALLALLKTAEKLQENISPALLTKIDRSIQRATDYLSNHQSDTGAWIPLWFGNQYTEDKTNPVYGTAKVCIYLTDCLAMQRPEKELIRRLTQMVNKAQDYLLREQNSDGSWGGGKGVQGTIEETSLAVSALALFHKNECLSGIEWLGKQETLYPAPIGLYFALLWYDEKLYPLIYYTEALRRFLYT
jgi:prenyltransferase beta subunit